MGILLYMGLAGLYIAYGIFEVVEPTDALEKLNGYDVNAVLEANPDWDYNDF